MIREGSGQPAEAIVIFHSPPTSALTTGQIIKMAPDLSKSRSDLGLIHLEQIGTGTSSRPVDREPGAEEETAIPSSSMESKLRARRFLRSPADRRRLSGLGRLSRPVRLLARRRALDAGAPGPHLPTILQ